MEKLKMWRDESIKDTWGYYDVIFGYHTTWKDIHYVSSPSTTYIWSYVVRVSGASSIGKASLTKWYLQWYNFLRTDRRKRNEADIVFIPDIHENGVSISIAVYNVVLRALDNRLTDRWTPDELLLMKTGQLDTE